MTPIDGISKLNAPPTRCGHYPSVIVRLSMDHFPTPKGAKPLKIPYISKEKYENDGEFLEYPIHRGWTLSEIYEDPSFGSKSPQIVTEFIQTWLYLGFLTEVFKFGAQVDFNVDDFIRQNDGKEYIQTTALPSLIEKWRIKDESATGDDVADRSFRILTAITGVGHFIDRRFEDVERYIGGNETSFTWPLISISIVALRWTLRCAMDKIYDFPVTSHSCKSKSVGFLKARLVQAGWCKGEIARFTNDLEIDGMYYIGFIKSPRRDQDHEMCDENACYGRGVDESTYVTKHVSTCNGCIFHPAPNDVVEIIKRGNTPIISWQDSKITVLEVSQQSEIPYLAISHVWSDGMGNPYENSLPACQLSRLQKYVDRLYSRPRSEQKKHTWIYGPTEPREPRDPKRKAAGFWMDTLCVPVHDETVRNKTISKMRNIYEGADRVLVIDAWLQKHLCRSSPVVESAVRLYLSNWQHRLWTLQEGVLAQNLYFQFKDGPQTLSSLWKQNSGDQESYQGLYGSIVGSTLIHVPMFNIHLVADADPLDVIADRFPPAITTVMTRNTTRKSDETICFATLLRMDPTPLLNIKGPKKDKLSKEEKQIEEQYRCQKRMEMFLETIETFQQWIIFHNLPRLDTEGFRWAPRSFLGHANEFLSGDRIPWNEYDDFKATLKKDRGGFQIKYPGIQLKFVGTHGKEIAVSESQGGVFWFCCSVTEDLNWDPTVEYVLISRYPVDDLKLSNEAIVGMRRGEDKDGNWRLQFLSTARVYWPETSLMDMVTERLYSQIIEDVPVTENDTSFVVGEVVQDRLWCLI